MIRELTLKLGPPGEAPLVIEPGAVTVIVGPNKAGKTTLLREIEDVHQSKFGREVKLLASACSGIPASPDVHEHLAYLVFKDFVASILNQQRLADRVVEQLARAQPTDREVLEAFRSLGLAIPQLRHSDGGLLERVVEEGMDRTTADRAWRAYLVGEWLWRYGQWLFEQANQRHTLPRDWKAAGFGYGRQAVHETLFDGMPSGSLGLGPFGDWHVRDSDALDQNAAATVSGIRCVLRWFDIARSALKDDLAECGIGAGDATHEEVWPVLTRLFEAGHLLLDPFLTRIPYSRVMLAGNHRFASLGRHELGKMVEPPESAGAILYRTPERLAWLNTLARPVLEGYRLTLDAITRPGLLRFVLVDQDPEPYFTRLTEASAAFFTQAREPEDFSRGLQAFVGLNIALVTEDAEFLCVDEPEVYLHPALARRMGRNVAEVAAERELPIFVATHSEHFLMGCVDSGQPLTILRLHNAADGQFAWTLSADDVAEMMNDPLLRSSDVLQGVFCRHAVVVEGETDRAFYSEVNLRLGEDGIDDVVWPTAFGKQTMHRIVELLRRVGVRTAAIVDIDVLTSGNEMKKLLKAQGVPQPLIDGMTATQGQTWRLCCDAVDDEKTLKKRLKREGLSALDGPARRSMRGLIDQLATYGLFVVPTGEVEGWLRDLTDDQSPQKGPDWLVHIFEQMGRADRPKVEPGDDDVWQFIRDVRAWMTQPRG